MRCRQSLLFLSFAILWALSDQGLLPATTVGASDSVEPFFQRHCVRCHGEKKQKGDFRIDTLSRDFSNQQAAEHSAAGVARQILQSAGAIGALRGMFHEVALAVASGFFGRCW